MIKTGDIFIVTYERDPDGLFINLALSDCNYLGTDFQIQQLWPKIINPTTETSIAEEDNFIIINPVELSTTVNDLKKSHPELFL